MSSLPRSGYMPSTAIQGTALDYAHRAHPHFTRTLHTQFATMTNRSVSYRWQRQCKNYDSKSLILVILCTVLSLLNIL